jgi:hypothetical protein
LNVPLKDFFNATEFDFTSGGNKQTI